MSGYLNRAQLIGNLGNDPEVRMTQAGKKVVTLSIATTESWTDQRSGERVERTEWHRVVIFNEGLAGIAERYLTKGAKVLIEGKIVTNRWQDREGDDRYTTEIQVQPFNGQLVFLSAKKPEGERTPGNDRGAPQPAMAGGGGGLGAGELDDEIPFGPCWQ